MPQGIPYLRQVIHIDPPGGHPRGVTVDKDTINQFWKDHPPKARRKGPAMAREATVGPIMYARVLELTKDGAMKNSEAFRQVAAEQLPDNATDDEKLKKERSVATTYYRLARLEAAGESAEAAPAPKKRGRPKGSTNKPKADAAPTASVTPATVVKASANGHGPDILTALGQADAAVKAAIVQARADQAELADLRSFKDKTQAVLAGLG